jgi:hypothetical protein
MAAQAASGPQPAKTIDEVIGRLDQIIEQSKRDASRLGYFATLYRNVTVEVKRGVLSGRFQNGPLMERLDVNFANRYLRAFDSYKRGGPASKCWVFAFRCAAEWPPLVLQHLLMGMNAHINLDLGAAAAETCPGEEIGRLKADFYEINAILAAMTAGVQWQLAQINPWMRLIGRVSGNLGERVMNWSIEKARDYAWGAAGRLAPLDPEAGERLIKKMDGEVDLLARLIRRPGYVLSLIAFVARFWEVRSTARIIDILA